MCLLNFRGHRNRKNSMCTTLGYPNGNLEPIVYACLWRCPLRVITLLSTAYPLFFVLVALVVKGAQFSIVLVGGRRWGERVVGGG